MRARVLAMVVVAVAFLTQFNKFLGAIVGGGVITVLVTLHVIPASLGHTLLTIIGAVGAAVGALLAAANKTTSKDPVPDHELEQADVATPDPDAAVVDEYAEQAISGGSAIPPAGDAPHPSPHAAQHATSDA